MVQYGRTGGILALIFQMLKVEFLLVKLYCVCQNLSDFKHLSCPTGYACKKENCSFTGKTWTELLKHNKESHTGKFQML